MIPFIKAYKAQNEKKYIEDVITLDKQSGDGKYTALCNTILQSYSPKSYPLLTTSCTHSMEMSALLLNIKSGDEVIIPSYSFSSCANAFLLRGAKIIFCDSQENNPNINFNNLESLITNNTKAFVIVHYAGVACAMDEILDIGNKYGIKVIEDAAQGMNAYYKGVPLGTIGELGCVSFHDTKNVSCGEGGSIFVNNPSLRLSADVIREKGTDRAAYFRGEVDKYDWKGLGSSYLLSDILAAKLLAQLEELEYITTKRKEIWQRYYDGLISLEKQGKCKLPYIPEFSDHNGHIFYLVCHDEKERDELIYYLKRNGIHSTFHYLSLHRSEFFKYKYKGCDLPNSVRFTKCLIRLPIYPELKLNDQKNIIQKTLSFYY